MWFSVDRVWDITVTPEVKFSPLVRRGYSLHYLLSHLDDNIRVYKLVTHYTVHTHSSHDR